MKKLILCCIIMFLVSINLTYAEQCNITCTTQAYDMDVTISGKIENATEKNQVTIMVGEPDNIIYINQVESAETGEFEFKFKMLEQIPEDGYTFKIGSNSGAEPYTGVLKKSKELIEVKDTFLKGNIMIGIYDYKPSIWGPVSCVNNTIVTISIINKTDNILLVEDVITSEDDSHYLDYILPSLLNRKEYEVEITCKDNEENVLAQMSVNIDSNILTVNIDGQVNTASDVTIDAELKTTGSDLVDKKTSFNGAKNINFTIPKLELDSSFGFILDGYKTISCEEESVYSGEYVLNVTGQEDIPIYDVAVNVVNSDNINDKIFTIEYPLLYLHLYSVDAYNQNNITVLENNMGILKYKIKDDTNIPTGKLLAKTVNILQFYGTTVGEYNISCTAVKEGELQ